MEEEKLVDEDGKPSDLNPKHFKNEGCERCKSQIIEARICNKCIVQEYKKEYGSDPTKEESKCIICEKLIGSKRIVFVSIEDMEHEEDEDFLEMCSKECFNKYILKEAEKLNA